MECHMPPLVDLIEIKMENHHVLVDNFPINRMIEVPIVCNFKGMVFIWDDSILKLDDIATTRLEIHEMVKVYSSNDTWLITCIYSIP